MQPVTIHIPRYAINTKGDILGLRAGGAAKYDDYYACDDYNASLKD